MRLKAFTPIRPLQWILFFMKVTVSIIGGIFLLNFSIDPFGTREWLVQKKYKPAVHERSEKYHTIFGDKNFQNYNCLILGSSRVMSISSDPNNKGERCYNFGVHVANNPEKLFILEEWLKRAPLKSLYLGNELYTMHAKNRPFYLDTHAFRGGSEGSYLSISTFLTSLKSSKNALLDEPQTYFKANGTIDYYQNEREIREGTYDQTAHHFHEMAYGSIQHDYIDTPFEYQKEALQPLREIQKLCDAHHVALYPFITPTYHETQAAVHAHPKLLAASEHFKRDLVTLFGTVYDFDVNNSYNQDPKNFYDVVHYRPSIGKQIFDRFHHNNGYGIVLHTPSTH